MPTTRRTTTRVQRTKGSDNSKITVILSWSVAIVFLILAAILSWIGSFYVFGHPEEPFSYRVLKSLGKIEPSKRFELTRAPRGQFLTPQGFLDRFGEMNARELEETNAVLLRNFIRNYQQTKEQVPYVIGNFVILDAFDLGPDDFMGTGVVALGRATEEPRVLVEHLFPAPVQETENLQRMLLTGLDLNLQRRLDLSAVIHVERLRDGRIKLTAVPLLYGTYTSTQGPGTFSLEPPQDLNVSAGLPVVRSARIESAFERYAAHRRRAGLPEDDPAAASAEAATARLLRIQRPEAVDGGAPPLAAAEDPEGAEAVSGEESDTPLAQAFETMRVLPALPVDQEPGETGEAPLIAPETEPIAEVAEAQIPRALPVEETAQPDLTPIPTPTPTPEAEPVVETTPTPAPSPPAAVAAIANVQGRDWQVFEPGRMPRGRLVPMSEIPELATHGTGGERLYLQGNFVVTASGDGRAVLRSQSAIRNPFGGGAANVRIIVDFPADAAVPAKDSSFARDSSRPFQITDITRGEDGQINVRAREITR